jgi:ferredoxin-NADP reductase
MAENFELVLQDYQMVSPRVRHLSFIRADNQSIAFTAGQFISLHIQKNGKELMRNYSIASQPEQTGRIDLACAYVEHGLASELLFNLQPGDKVHASGVYGRFYLKTEPVRRYILIATGTGVTPYRSMLNEIERRMQTSNLEVIVIMGGRSREEMLYRNEFLHFADQQPNFSYLACYSRLMPDQPLAYEYSGHVQDVFKLLNIDGTQDLAYLCGHPDMVDACFSLLQILGLDKRNIRREKYVFGMQA